MYYGRYYHKIESKGRVSLPARFREKLGRGGVITRGLDGCLAIYDQMSWEKKLREAESLTQTKKAHREYVRHLTNDAQELEIDSLGRINIAEELKLIASLEKAVVFVGSLDHIEVWNQEKYHEYIANVNQTIEETIERIDVS